MPRKDPLAPRGGVLINGGAAATPVNAVRLAPFTFDAVSPHLDDPANPVPDPSADRATQVTEMLISNTPDFAGAVWEPYANSKAGMLSELSGLGDVSVRMAPASRWMANIPRTPRSFSTMTVAFRVLILAKIV